MYHIFCVILENRALVYFDGGVKASCVDDGYGFGYVGIGVSLGRVIAAQRSLKIIFTLILIALLLTIF